MKTYDISIVDAVIWFRIFVVKVIITTQLGVESSTEMNERMIFFFTMHAHTRARTIERVG